MNFFKASIFLVLSSTICYAESGVIAVLEAPLFSNPSTKSDVIQYKRKGDKVYIHSSALKQDKLKHIIRKDVSKNSFYTYQEEYPDQLFQKENEKLDILFYKTMTRSGRTAYILKKHVFVFYNDTRELVQDIPQKDETDYRVAEPIPKDFPLKAPSGYRGQILFSIGSPTNQPFPYSQKTIDSGFDFNKELSFVWSKQFVSKKSQSQRLFWGGEFNIFTGQSRYITDDIVASESQLRLSTGPYISYDAWIKPKHTINIHGSLLLNFYNTRDITQDFEDNDIEDQTVRYTSLYISPTIGLSYHYKKIIGSLDIVSGVKVIMNPSHTYKTRQSVKDQWTSQYKVDLNFDQSYYLGIQTDY